MGKTLIKISPPIWPIFEVEIEIILKELEKKNKVEIITCDGEKKFCVANENMNKIKCLYCKKRLKDGINFLEKFHKNKITSIVENQKKKLNYKQLKAINKVKLKKQLLKLKYENMDIGTSILSTLVTQYNTENISINKRKKLIEEIFRQSINSLENFKKIIKNKFYKKILIFNGRIYNYRPLLRYSQKFKLNTYCYDYAYFSHSRYLIKKNNFTQNMNERSKEIFNLYKKRKHNFKKKIIYKNGISFFKGRIQKKNTGPFAIFNAIQKNILPKEFIKKKFNICFFTSSDLETSLITDDHKRFIYSNQLKGITKIIRDLKIKKNIYFFIRLHPNFAKDHENTNNFLRLESRYNNLKIIKPLSNIDSYKLAKNSDLIIAFGSTIGIESVFLRKNVINLGPSAYKEFKIDYQPTNHSNTLKTISKLIFRNKFKNQNYAKSIYAADAMINQGKELTYLKRKDIFNSHYLIKGIKYRFIKLDIIYIVYLIEFSISRSLGLVKLLFQDYNLFKFKLFNYIVRLKNILFRN